MVELLTSDQGIGLAALKEKKRDEEEYPEDMLKRVTSEFFRQPLQSDMLRMRAYERAERNTLDREQRAELAKYERRLQLYGHVRPVESITTHLLTVPEEGKEDALRTEKAPIILNHDDLLREQLCEMGRLMNLENIVCEAKSQEA